MRWRSIFLVAVVALTAASCATSPGVSTQSASELGPGVGLPQDPIPGQTLPEPSESSIEWGPCADAQAVPLEVECGSITVPLDYAAPDGRMIDIAVARVATVNDDERIGSVVFNPGGPGASGIDFLQTVALVMPEEISQRFDLVSFDPRGVGASTAVDCDNAFDDEITLLDEGDDAGWDALVAEAEGRPSMCTSDTIEIGSWLGTNNAARDLDEIRAALGDDRLSYVGFSYGTRLGATYAELFPDRVRALVLDGAVAPTNDFTELDAEQAASLDRAFEQFAQACDADADCDLAAAGPTLEVYSSLVASIAESGSIPTDDPDRVVTPGELQLAVIAAMYSTQLWPVLAQGMYDASVDSDATLLQVLADSYLGRLEDGSYDNSQDAGFTINCADNLIRPPTEVVRAESEEIASNTKWFDDFLRASTGCIGGPAAIDPLIVGTADGAPPILVIGNTGDPATPYEWSVAMADFLTSGQLYTGESDGHTAFLSVPCVTPVVVEYLVDLEMPAPGASCVNDEGADPFPPVGEGDFDKVIALFDCLRENGAD
ncbi:MAG TPA: alpha/beta hydrolase, partial [Ilumatobacteraceae bacterium]|nr:alpha/beta hydrolase [Ilumatobacteraceae bacterium]